MKLWSALALVIILEALCVLLGVWNYGWTIDGLQATTRFSGRLSLAIFSIIFLFHRHATINPSWFLSDRYFLMFAIAHGIHLVELLSFQYQLGGQFIITRAIGGAIAYALIFVMPWIQYRHSEDQITEKRFNQFSLVYLYYVWFVFFMTYLPRVRGTATNVGGSYLEFVVLLGWVSLMLGIKWSQLFARPLAKRR